jgi:hypothetical protein
MNILLGGTKEIENVKEKHQSEIGNLTTKIKNHCQ